MATTIASLAVQLSANANELYASIDGTQGRLKTMADVAAAVGDKMAAELDKKATLAGLQKRVEDAQRALSGFRGEGGAVALANLAANLGAAKTALASFQAETAPAPTLLQRFTGALKTLGGAAGGAIGFIGQLFRSTVDFLSSIPVVGGFFAAIPNSVKGFVDLIKNQISEMAAVSREARRMGVSVETLSGIQVLAGASSDAMARGLFHLSRLLGEVSAGSKEAEKTFRDLGLDGRALAAMPLDQSLGAIMDKMQSLASPTERAYLAFKLFGKTGYELMPVLTRGSAALAEATQRAKDFGLSFGDDTAAAMERARRSLGLVDMLAKGLQRQFAIEMAPIVAEIADSFVKWVQSMGGAKGAFSKMADVVGGFLASAIEGFATLIDQIKELAKSLSDLTKSGATKQIEDLQAQLYEQARQQAAAQGNKEAIAAAPAVPVAQGGPGSFTDQMRDLAKRLRDRKGFFNRPTPAAGTERLPGQATQDLIEKAGELEEKLKGEVAAFGGASAAMERWRLAQKGATPEMLKTVDALIAEKHALESITGWASGAGNIFDDYAVRLDALKRALDAGTISAEGYAAAAQKLGDALQKSMSDKAAEAFQNTRTPLEKYQDKIKELQGLLNAGQIDWDIYRRAVSAASNELINLKKNQENRHPAAVQFGTQEAFKQIVEFQNPNRQKDPATELRDAIRQQNEMQKAQTAIQERIARAVEAGNKQGVW